MADQGGGASRTTDPAGGTSTATDISLREFGDAVRSGDIRFLNERTTRLEEQIRHAREMSDMQRRLDQVAIDKALESAKELAQKHNDLIHAGEKKDETYATKEEVSHLAATLRTEMNRLASFQSKLTGGLLLLSAIGLANFIRVWIG